jgi:hypothetical protein
MLGGWEPVGFGGEMQQLTMYQSIRVFNASFKITQALILFGSEYFMLCLLH